jgi:hypothetical protein
MANPMHNTVFRPPEQPEQPGMGMIPTPMGWMTPERAQALMRQLGQFSGGPFVEAGQWLGRQLTPSRAAVADGLGAPVDAGAWLARQVGFNVPSTYFGPTGERWAPDASVPGSSTYFHELLRRRGLF